MKKNINMNWYKEKYNKFVSENFWNRTKTMENKLEKALNKLWE